MRHTVLVVEDGLDLREILELTLSNAGFTVIVAESATAALARVKEFPHLDLVLADFNLPDGKDLVPTLKKLRPNLPVVVLSGDPYRARAELPQADAVLGKPVSGNAIVNELRRFLSAA
jgi:CheY-like chemotaxis protein